MTTKARGTIWGPGALIVFWLGSSIGWKYVIPVIILLVLTHMIVAYLFRKDHRYFEIAAKYEQLADRYQPHAREKLPAPFERPEGMGRNLRI